LVRGKGDLLSNSSRVLVVETQSTPGGWWHYACVLSRALADTGCEVALATTVPFEPLEETKSIRVIAIGTRPTPSSFRPLSWLRRALFQFDRFRRLGQAIREFRPDIIHFHNTVGKLDFLYFRWLRLFRRRIVYTAHDIRLDSEVTWFDWARFRAADAILVHSLNAREDLKAGGIDEARIVRIHHGNYLHLCPPSSISPEDARSSLGLHPDDQVVLFFGTISPYKGLDLLIDAFAKVCLENRSAYLVIAGEPLQDFTPYRRLIESYDLTRRVLLDLRYIPFSDFPKYFTSAHAVIFPYRQIYQSGVLQLAYAYGRPVVVTNVGGLGETVAEDQTGLVVPAEDVGALVSAIHSMLADSTAAEEMGRRGRWLAETKYGWDTIAQQISETYRSVRTDSLNELTRNPRALPR
jgi:D-inositol-3-phosphate glycosyltransferase